MKAFLGIFKRKKKGSAGQGNARSTATVNTPAAGSEGSARDAALPSTSPSGDIVEADRWKQHFIATLNGKQRDAIKALARAGIPSSLRAWAWPRLLGIDRLAAHDRNYEAALRRVFGPRRPTHFQPPCFGATIDASQMELTEQQSIDYKYLLCIVGHDCPHLEFTPIIPAISLVLLKSCATTDVFGCLMAMIRGRRASEDAWSYFPVHRRDFLVFERVFLGLIAKFAPEVAQHIKQVEEGDPQYGPQLMPLMAEVFIGMLPTEYIYQVFDCYLVEGYKVLLRFAVALLVLKKDELLQTKTPAELDAALCSPLSPAVSYRKLSKTAFKLSFSRSIINRFRARHRNISLDAYDSEDRRLMLHRPLPHLVTPSSFLTDLEWQAIWSWVPLRFRLLNLDLVFTTAQHGHNLSTFYSKCDTHEPSLLFIETASGKAIGAFLSRAWRHRTGASYFFGTGETFIFTLRPSPPAVFRWHHDHPCSSFMAGTDTMIAIGGGLNASLFGLWINREMTTVHSSRCETFDNAPLLGLDCSSDEIYSLEVFSGRTDLAGERARASFDIREMTDFINGGAEQTRVREQIMLEYERDPSFRMHDVHDLTQPDIRERIMTRLPSIIQWRQTDLLEQFQKRLDLLAIIDPGFQTRIGVHFGLFCQTIIGQGTPEQVCACCSPLLQVKHWLGQGILTFGVIGCFAMTELGHGSNVAGLETTAVFDREADEFIIHSPTPTSTKWWIGGAAESATHAAVFANLIVDGKKYGVKPFVVPLRDRDTFRTFPGVDIGDIGAKMGRNGIDNGWIQFTHCRIPRSYLLMRFTQVDRQGRVTEPPIAQLAYGALVFVRTSIIRESAETCKKALTIAMRYSCVRRQFAATAGDASNAGSDGHQRQEGPIMDFATHKQRLIPLLATAYAMHFTGTETTRIYNGLMAILGVAKPGDAKMQEALEALRETHGTTAGVKAFCTWKTAEIIDQCRQACGGQGYSSYAGLASLYADFVVQCTWEGDNTVLTLQAGRYLLSCFRDKMQRNAKLPIGVDYLNRLPAILSARCQADPTSLESIGEAFDQVCSHLVANAAKALQEASQGRSKQAAFETTSSSRFLAAKLHCMGYLFHRFRDALSRAPDGPVKQILLCLCRLYGLHSINEHAGPFLQYAFFTARHVDQIQRTIIDLLDELRPQVIPLTDAFALSDYILNSPIGCYDGDVYRRLIEHTRNANPVREVHPYFERVIKPVLHRQDRVIEQVPL